MIGVAACLIFPAASTFAAEGCASLPPARFSLYFVHDEQPEIRSMGSDELAKLRERIGQSAEAGLYTDGIGVLQDVSPLRIELEVDPHASDLGGFCAAPETVVVRIGFPVRRIAVLREAAADACVRQAILAHAGRHLALDKATLETFFQRIRPDVQGALVALRQAVPAPSAAEAIDGFKASLERFFRAAALKFLNERRLGHDLIDTPEEIENVRDACRSRVRQLEPRRGF